MKTRNYKVFSVDVIKYIAVFCMLIDHIAAVFLPEGSVPYVIMRLLGSFTCPLMCFFVVEGYRHTRNINRYLIRLFIFALASQLPYRLINPNNSLNFIFNLFLAVLFLKISDSSLQNNKPVLLAVLVLFFGVSLFCDWFFVPLLSVIILYKFRENVVLKYALLSIVFTLYAAVADDLFFVFRNMFSIFSVFLLMFYNGQKSQKFKKFNKWFFYVFYPAHFVLLYLVFVLI